MNRCDLIGRLTKDVETHKNGDKVVSRFSIAVNRRYKAEGQPDADFLNCVAFGKTADFISKYFKKGMKIAIEGRIQTGSYEKDGVKKYTTDIVVESCEFCESKKAENTPVIKEDADGFINIPEGIDEELPFN